MSDLTLIEPDEALKPLITYLALGDDPALDAQLIEKSRQFNILQYTPKDAAERFGDPAMLARWRTKGRTIHWLLGPDRALPDGSTGPDLAGIIWYGAAPFPLDSALLTPPLSPADIPQVTFAIRLYDGYAGKRLAKPFMRQSIETYIQGKKAQDEPFSGIWLQTDTDNPAALSAYVKFGYTEVARDSKRVTMILSPKYAEGVAK